MKYLSPSKVNLGLRVVGRRIDGYHCLESLFWPIDLNDEIQIERANKNKVTLEWHSQAPFPSALPKAGEDSVSKLLEEHPELGYWEIHIQKRIPVGGGLGGSSSNVGTVLKAFIELGLIDAVRAKSLALRSGADVPFFLNPVPSWVTGIGEHQQPIGLSEKLDLRFFLFLFEEPCITKTVFQSFKRREFAFSKPSDMPIQWSAQNFFDYLAHAGNDLEKVVALEREDIDNCLKFLVSLKPFYSGLSGSGSTCFAVSRSDAAREIISKEARHFCRKSNCSFIEVNTFRA